jgi:hypothetical protein
VTPREPDPGGPPSGQPFIDAYYGIFRSTGALPRIAATYSVSTDKISAADFVVTTYQSMAGVHSLAILVAVSPDFTLGDGPAVVTS